jgi:predicted N-formylglutamate amidohydrolase
MTRGLVISCEHASARVPAPYAKLFASQAAKRALASHRGFDPGALAVARFLAGMLNLPLYATCVSRLLVEPNRTLGHPNIFSAFSAQLDEEMKRRVIAEFYVPHRQRVEAAVQAQLARHRATLHVSVHSFTPVLDGEERRAHLGLLYDPRRPAERLFAERWQAALSARLPELRIRRNYPYRGASDGFTTALRKTFGARYLGFEVEINQTLIASSSSMRRAIALALRDTLRVVL